MLDPLWTALMTLTRIPAPALAKAPDATTIGRSAVFYPLVGALLGGLAALIYTSVAPMLPQTVVVLILLGFWALITGALHEDGLADTFDAFGSQTSREAIFRVLKDSRIGSYGAAALALSTLLRWQGLTMTGETHIVPLLVAVQTLPRSGIVALAYLAGPASDGTGSALARAVRPLHVVLASLVGLGICGLVLAGQLISIALSCVAVVLPCAVYFRRRLGGVTGDCLGAACQMQEIAILLIILAVSGDGWPGA